MPQDLLRRLIAARTFNQGCATLEYVASALIDLDSICGPRGAAGSEALDINSFERATLARIEMPREIVMRHRPTHLRTCSGGLCRRLLQLHVVGGARRGCL